MRSFSWSASNFACDTIDSRSIRSRLIEESTSWSVTSIARMTVKPSMTNRSGGRSSISGATSKKESCSRARSASGSTGVSPSTRTWRKLESNMIRKWRVRPVSGSGALMISGKSISIAMP